MDAEYHLVVAGLLVSGRHVLLCHRCSSRNWYPDTWDLPGGHVEQGESATEALVRELREELAIDVSEPRDECFARIEGDGFDLSVWRMLEWSGTPRNAAPDEHDGLGWFTATEVTQLRLAHGSYPSLVTAALHWH